jgi:hypothetical protein
MNPWVSPISGKKTLSVFVVPDWWHSGVGVGIKVGDGVDFVPVLAHPARNIITTKIMGN